MEKINIAELLRNCPKGMELDCTMFDEVKLVGVDEICITPFPIRVRRVDGYNMTLTKYGQYADADFAKCVIFPKGKTTWEGFVPPNKFKDGDIVVCEEDKMATKKFIIEVEKGATECKQCPLQDIDCGCGVKMYDIINCGKYDLATMKIKEYEEN